MKMYRYFLFIYFYVKNCELIHSACIWIAFANNSGGMNFALSTLGNVTNRWWKYFWGVAWCFKNGCTYLRWLKSSWQQLLLSVFFNKRGEVSFCTWIMSRNYMYQNDCLWAAILTPIRFSANIIGSTERCYFFMPIEVDPSSGLKPLGMYM